MQKPLNLLVILGSDRPGRIGERVGQVGVKELVATVSGTLQKIKEDGTWIGTDDKGPAFKSVVDELFWWTSALKVAREATAYPA